MLFRASPLLSRHITGGCFCGRLQGLSTEHLGEPGLNIGIQMCHEQLARFQSIDRLAQVILVGTFLRFGFLTSSGQLLLFVACFQASGSTVAGGSVAHAVTPSVTPADSDMHSVTCLYFDVEHTANVVRQQQRLRQARASLANSNRHLSLQGVDQVGPASRCSSVARKRARHIAQPHRHENSVHIICL